MASTEINRVRHLINRKDGVFLPKGLKAENQGTNQKPDILVVTKARVITKTGKLGILPYSYISTSGKNSS